MTKQANEQAHAYATAKAMAYVAKFGRPVLARAVDGVYLQAFVLFLAKATQQETRA